MLAPISIFVDGSQRERGFNETVRCSFAVVAVEGDPNSPKAKIIQELSSLLITDKLSKFYLPISNYDNYTSEMVAAAEGILHILQNPHFIIAPTLELYSDSLSVVETLNGECHGQSEQKLYLQVRAWITQINMIRAKIGNLKDKFFKISHINSHAKEKNITSTNTVNKFRFNERADVLAGIAADNDFFCYYGRFRDSDQANNLGSVQRILETYNDTDINNIINDAQLYVRRNFLKNIAGFSEDTSLGIVMSLDNDDTIGLTTSINHPEEFETFIKNATDDSGIMLSFLFNNKDKDSQDYNISAPNGWCSFNHIYALEQLVLNGWNEFPDKMSFPPLGNANDRETFITSLKRYQLQVAEAKKEGNPILVSDIQKVDKMVSEMERFHKANVSNPSLHKSHWPNDDPARYVRPDIPRFLLTANDKFPGYDSLLSSTILPQKTLYWSPGVINLFFDPHTLESVHVVKLQTEHIFPSTGPKIWKNNTLQKSSEALLSIGAQIKAFNNLQLYEPSPLQPTRILRSTSKVASATSNLSPPSRSPTPPTASASSTPKGKKRKDSIKPNSKVKDKVSKSDEEYYSVSRITAHEWRGTNKTNRKLYFHTYWLKEDGQEEYKESDFCQIDQFPTNNHILQKYIVDKNLQSNVPKRYLAPIVKGSKPALPSQTSFSHNSQSSQDDFIDQECDDPEFDSRHYHPDHGPNTRLVDIPFDMLGVLVGNTMSVQDIPEQLRGRVRKVYITQLQRIKKNPKSSEEWHKFMLLPTVLFGKYINSVNNKTGMKKALSRLQKDDWSFTLGEFMKKRDPSKPSKATTQDIVHKKAMVCAQKGEISKAMAIITSTATLVQPTPQVVTNLQSKFPANNQSMFTVQEIKAFQDFVAPPDTRIGITAEVLRLIISSRHNMIRPSFDGARYEHLQQIIGKGLQTELDEITVTKLLAEVLEFIINDEAPREYMNALAHIELVPLLKENGDLRPIGMNFAVRKVVSLLVIRFLKSKESKEDPTFLETHLPPLQMAMEKNGTEKIAHAMALDFDLHPERCKFAIDGVNSFNAVSKTQALINIKKHVPHILPFVRAMYGNSSKAWYYGLKEGITHIDVDEGSTQGDVLGTFCYAMAINPFLQQMRAILGDQGFLAFFVDDGNVSADFDDMCRVLQFIEKEGSKYGYVINKQKGSYCLGKCDSYDTALERKDILISLGLSPDIIHIHPDNFPENVNNDIKESAKERYGMKVLGVYMGSAEFIQLNLSLKLKKLINVKDKIIAFPDKQVRNLMLRWSFCAKINHLLRTTPASLMLDFTHKFTQLKKEIFCSLINDKHFPSHDFSNDSLPERIWLQAQLHLNEGGLGLQDHILTSHAAYIASLTEATKYISIIHSNFSDILQDSDNQQFRIVEYRKSVSVINVFDPGFTSKSVFTLKPDKVDMTLQNAIMRLTRKKVLQQFESTFSHGHDLGWFKCLQGNYAGLWLERTPTASRFHMDSKKFTVALRYRLRLPMPSINEGSYCTCKAANPGKNKLDVYGYHLTILCGKHGFRHKIHDGIVLTINACCHANGVYTQHEPRNLFHANEDENNKRPDLLLINPPGFNKPRIVIDVNVTHPIRDNTTLEQAKNFHNGSIAAKTAERLKINKFTKDCDLADIGFNALIFESTGKPSSQVETFLTKVIANSSEAKGMKTASNLRYWMTAISFNVQTNIANSIIQRSIILHSKGQSKLNHKDSCPDHVHLSDCIDGVQYNLSPLPDSDYDNSSNNVFDSNFDHPYMSCSQDKSLFGYSQNDDSQFSDHNSHISQQSYNSTTLNTQTTLLTPDMSRSNKRPRPSSNLNSPVSPSSHNAFKKMTTISNDNPDLDLDLDFTGEYDNMHDEDYNDTLTPNLSYVF